MFSHYAWLWSPDGTDQIDDLSDFMTLDCVLAEMNIGTLTLTLPPTHDYSRFRRDARIAYYRSPPRSLGNGFPRLVGGTTWPLIGRKRRLEQTGDGGWRETVTIKAVHPNHFLARRVVAYDETTSQADKTAAADDSIKAYVNENFVSATDGARNWASSLFTVDANLSAAPSIAKTASYRTVLNVCQELAAAATASGTYTGFEVVGARTGVFRLRTYTGQRGADRSSTSGQALVISVTMGAFGDVELEEDWTNLANAIFAGGGGRGDERLTTFVSDTASIAESPYGWSEWFQQAGGTTDATVLNDAAMQALREHRARILFTGSVKDTERATFGEEYDWGDRVVGEYARPDPLGSGFVDTQQFDCRVDPVHIHVERSEDPETGEQTETETLDIRLRSES